MQNNSNKTILCKYFWSNGTCRFGDQCWFLHDVPPTVETTLSTEISSVATPDEEKDVKIAAVNLSNGTHCPEDGQSESEHCCSICFESVSNTKTKLFGLVSGCDHCFCLSCLREWRYSKNNPSDSTRLCPVCRVDIKIVVPSIRFVTGEEKEAVINNHFKNMALKPCKHFKAKLGTCPFGQDCYYAHLSRNGEDMKPNDFKKPRQQPRIDMSSLERDLVLLSRLLNHRVRFPFAMFDDDEEDDDGFVGDGIYYGKFQH